jgi:haloacid dehalogenase superfamily, subfamily IA, variant 3 with third motif having DD or ED/haloacid dehalogenase superfamily, subfamily IA, variant 1 with third motif having Dx(3-4)D or Dx(3-4)E
MHTRAAIFDFDETIINLELQHDAAVEALCASRGSSYDALPPEWRHRSGIRIYDEVVDMRRIFGWSESVDDLYAARQRFFMEACTKTELRLMPGARRAIEMLHDLDLRLGVASSGVRDYLEMILSRVGLRSFFDVIIAGEDVSHGKPHPESFLAAAERLGVEPSECIVFEDSTVGVQSAKSAGMYCVAVPNPAARLPQDVSPADRILPGLEAFTAEMIP